MSISSSSPQMNSLISTRRCEDVSRFACRWREHSLISESGRNGNREMRDKYGNGNLYRSTIKFQL